jgi:fucose permease
MLVFGMILALPGTVLGLPEFTERFQLTLSDRGTFIAALFGGLLIGSALSGTVVGRSGYRYSIAGSAAAIAVLLPAFALATSYQLAVAALFGLGLSSATLNTAANALASDLFPDERGRRMTMLAIAFSGGGLLLPTAIAAAAHLVSWRTVLLDGAGLASLVAGAALIVKTSASASHGRAAASLRTLLHRPRVGRFCLLIACGAANEGTFAGWTSSYLIASGFTPVAATWGLSSHWLGLLIGRIVFAGRVDSAKTAAIVRAAIAGAAALLCLIVVPFPPVLLIGPFAGGIAIGVIVPASLALAGERIAGNAGTLFGLLLTMAQVGGMVLPPLIGAVADAASLRLALLLAVTNAVIIAILALQSSANTSPIGDA